MICLTGSEVLHGRETHPDQEERYFCSTNRYPKCVFPADWSYGDNRGRRRNGKLLPAIHFGVGVLSGAEIIVHVTEALLAPAIEKDTGGLNNR